MLRSNIAGPFRITSVWPIVFEILRTYRHLVTLQYFDDLQDLMMTMEEVDDLGSGYSQES